MHQPAPLLTRSEPTAALSSHGLARAIELGRSILEDLRADDPRLQHTVHMACKDGTNLNLPHAFIQNEGDWVYVFTRDHGWFVEHKDALAMCSSTARQGA